MTKQEAVGVPKCYVWGIGPASSPLLRDAEHSDAALRAASRYGWERKSFPEMWAVEVAAEEDDVEAATRADRAVHGWMVAEDDVDGPPDRAQEVSRSTAVVEIPRWALDSREWSAALYLLGAPALRGKGCMRYVDFTGARLGMRGIDFPSMQEDADSWSRGERILVALANRLFNGDDGMPLDITGLWETLDPGNLAYALEAIARRAGRSLRVCAMDLRMADRPGE